MKGVVEPSYKNTTRIDANCAGHSSKIRVEAALSNTYSEMSESTGKFRKSYIYNPKYRSKHTCLIFEHSN